MWRTDVGAAAVCLALFLSQLAGEGGTVTVLSRPGDVGVTLPCGYGYENGSEVSRLSVQWRSPAGELLCHFIKHKAFRNCSAGYDFGYRPGSIALTVREVRDKDFGTHVCSVSKPHDFSDSSVELLRMADSVTSAPVGGVSHHGLSWRLALLHTFTHLLCMYM